MLIIKNYIKHLILLIYIVRYVKHRNPYLYKGRSINNKMATFIPKMPGNIKRYLGIEENKDSNSIFKKKSKFLNICSYKYFKYINIFIYEVSNHIKKLL